MTEETQAFFEQAMKQANFHSPEKAKPAEPAVPAPAAPPKPKQGIRFMFDGRYEVEGKDRQSAAIVGLSTAAGSPDDQIIHFQMGDKTYHIPLAYFQPMPIPTPTLMDTPTNTPTPTLTSTPTVDPGDIREKQPNENETNWLRTPTRTPTITLTVDPGDIHQKQPDGFNCIYEKQLTDYEGRLAEILKKDSEKEEPNR
jgi:hypothetical protein